MSTETQGASPEVPLAVPAVEPKGQNGQQVPDGNGDVKDLNKNDPPQPPIPVIAKVDVQGPGEEQPPAENAPFLDPEMLKFFEGIEGIDEEPPPFIPPDIEFFDEDERRGLVYTASTVVVPRNWMIRPGSK